MFRFVFGIFFLNFMYLTLSFSSKHLEGVNTFPEWPAGLDNFTNETKDWHASGQMVDIGDYPYDVSVQVLSHDYGHNIEAKCTDTLIDVKLFYDMFLTAAHCVSDGKRIPETPRVVSASAVTIRYGSVYSGRGASTLRVKKIYIHKHLCKNKMGITFYDKAMIETKREKGINVSGLSNVKPSWTRQNLYVMQKKHVKCLVVGYGITDKRKSDLPLRAVKIKLITFEECQKMVKSMKLRILQIHLYAYTKGADPCHEGGGSPLICPKLHGPTGILPFGKNCGKDRPAVFLGLDFHSQVLSYQTTYYSSNYLWKADYPEVNDPHDADDASGSPEDTSEMQVGSGFFTCPRLYVLLFIMEITRFKTIETKGFGMS